MNYKVVISDSAKEDIKESAQWYNKQQNGLGRRFVRSIRKCIDVVRVQPESFQIRYKDNRVAIPEVFPFLIVYNLNKNDKIIRIIAVFHTSLNPDKLKERK
jgi:plasmid stabilization system protein ParE